MQIKSFTQEITAGKIGQWGVKAGYFHSLLHFQEGEIGGLACYYDLKRKEFSGLSGLKIGGFYEKSFNVNLSLLAGFDIILSKTTLEIENCFICTRGLISERSGNVNVGSVHFMIPVAARYNTGIHKIFLEAGAFASINLGANHEYTQIKYRELAPPILLPTPEVSQEKISLSSFNMGVHAGIGKKIALTSGAMELKLHYYHGLNKSINFDANYSLTQSGAEASVAYRF